VFSYTYFVFLNPPWNDLAIPKDATDSSWNSEFQQQFLTAFVAPPNTSPLSAAQDAMVTALMAVAGSPAHVFPGEGGGKVAGGSLAQIDAAAHRFASLSPAARHAWLAAHLSALRAGTITLAQLP
jgi:hypothetical protein